MPHRCDSDLPFDHVGGFQLAKTGGQQAGGNAGEPGMTIVKPTWADAEIPHDEERTERATDHVAARGAAGPT